MEPGFTLLTHTADVKVRAAGRDFGSTLANLVRGMLAVLYDDPAVPGEFTRDLVVAGHDGESLVVSFLNEVLYVLESEGLLPSDITEVRKEDAALYAAVTWGRAKGRMVREIKAATYHQLLITDTLMEVVLDL